MFVILTDNGGASGRSSQPSKLSVQGPDQPEPNSPKTKQQEGATQHLLSLAVREYLDFSLVFAPDCRARASLPFSSPSLPLLGLVLL